MPMIVISAQLHCVSRDIPGDRHKLLSEAKQKFSQAATLADSYTKTWHSIFWQTSKAGVKRTVKETLNHIAFEAYSLFLEGAELLNDYADIMGDQPSPIWWDILLAEITSINEDFKKYHSQEIKQRQLLCVHLMTYLPSAKTMQ